VYRALKETSIGSVGLLARSVLTRGYFRAEHLESTGGIQLSADKYREDSLKHQDILKFKTPSESTHLPSHLSQILQFIGLDYPTSPPLISKALIRNIPPNTPSRHPLPCMLVRTEVNKCKLIEAPSNTFLKSANQSSANSTGDRRKVRNPA